MKEKKLAPLPKKGDIRKTYFYEDKPVKVRITKVYRGSSSSGWLVDWTPIPCGHCGLSRGLVEKGMDSYWVRGIRVSG